ncbi:MAG TPA: prepilin-type N-terminal cleavage/methylation domain-containing protein [Kiritimatiellia bacterium]|nr:prepilin-type N-terminal cleavage/methylation domain-containing protein [Kiritimatiellia bacterium]
MNTMIQTGPFTAGSLRRKSGFSLIELLVVIAIIAILAGLLFPALNAVMQRSESAQARTEVKAIEMAVRSFYTDYGRFPIGSGQPDQAFGIGNNANGELIRILRAISGPGNVNHVNNPRRRNYLDINENSLLNDNLVDPWGNQYVIVMDTNFDNQLTMPPATALGTLQGRTVGVFSLGPQMQMGAQHTNNYIVSWKN